MVERKKVKEIIEILQNSSAKPIKIDNENYYFLTKYPVNKTTGGK